MKKMMALDLGEKRMGIALNRGTRFAFPWQVFSSGTVKENINTILDIVRQLDIETIVIGFPIRLNTAIKEEAQRVLRFKEELGKYFPGEIVLFDERLTTKEAEKRLLEMDL
ncbi:MAG: Holliday junction resolvase RuvX, partial [Atribacterota bacterium]